MKTLKSLLPLAMAAFLLPMAAQAVGSDDDTPPEPTESTTECADGMVWDADAQSCVTATKDSLLDTDRLKAAHELAYHGRAGSALMVLAALDSPRTSQAQTLYGFSQRKLGNMAQAMVHYQAALATDPDNILARSYMGQGLIQSGDLTGALRQLREIEARGGTGTWAHAALDGALRGLPTDY
ncbi:tetratricopeptide repeat protein [Pseudooceanicola sp. HF7]|uniref:tetratricopeptide repeat protein n=1 Tax=Pseudooceanicola sp. HF7 TaxID=2721560 RepID=UPI0014311622|nr:tetratricopeptide repeat protein [Pseudooceanicola sp. HF7]NIZ10280.1 hypothetical protein [Pseudooceanicola sp. HF7]